MSLQGHRHVLAVDLAFDETVHGFDEILAVIARVKSQDVRGQHVGQHFALPRTHAERLRIGPRYVPEKRNRRLRYPGAYQLRQQREMKVLNQHNRTVDGRLGRHHLGKLGVHFTVIMPVAARNAGRT